MTDDIFRQAIKDCMNMLYLYNAPVSSIGQTEVTVSVLVKPMKKSKYNFSRNWYVAEFDYKRYAEVIAWSTAQFGPRPRASDAWTRWFSNYGDRIFFRDEQDYMLFILRWS